MEMRIELKSWKCVEKDKGEGKTVAGAFSVKCGDETVATRDFNQGYGNMTIAIPAAVMVKVEEIDKEIKQIVINNFRK